VRHHSSMPKGGLHGWTRIPGGVLARFHETDPTVGCGSLDVFVSAPTRQEAVAKAKSLGLHGISLKTNPSPPTDAEVREFVAHGQDMLWRRWEDDGGPWLTAETWGLLHGQVTPDLWRWEAPLEGCASCPSPIPRSSATTL
jgi:hypothetical protein